MMGKAAFKVVQLFALLPLLASPLVAQGPPGIHPWLRLRDSSGTAVQNSGNPVSLRRSCGGCHDVDFIASHSSHSTACQSGLLSVATQASSRPLEPIEGGSAEPNCLICHTPNPANDQWINSLREGDTEWAVTSTLANTSIVERSGDRWRWNPDAFTSSGTVNGQLLRILRPSNENCGLCHGITGSGLDEPVSLESLGPGSMHTLTTGEIFSPQRIANSGINLRDKNQLSRTWDVHAERLVDCTDCHHSINNPAYCRESDESQPKGLRFDGRRVPFAVYLRRPNHNLAGQSGSCSGEEVDLSCQKCHDPAPTHGWLPYAERHFAQITCQACHTPRLFSVAVESVDWTRLSADGSPRVTYRGSESEVTTAADDLVDGFEPVLLTRQDADGRTRLAPYNLVTSWYWVAGDPERPVPIDSLRLALDSGVENAELLAAFDSDGNGSIDNEESVLDTEAKVSRTRDLLVSFGFESPRIVGEIQPYSINHNTIGAGWAARECESCHQAESRMSHSVVLSSVFPTGVVPIASEKTDAFLLGDALVDEDGRLLYEPASKLSGFYVLGHNSVRWANVLGFLAVVGVLFGVVAHALLRWRATRGRAPTDMSEAAEVYMYTVYERFWHWLQALAIMILLVTGIEIHFSAFDLFGFALAVSVHNVVGFVVVANALFAALYHFASGDIRQYLPKPQGFFDQAIDQARYYLGGIFHGRTHPFEKTPERKLNPLQQLTYLSILNILLPIQIVTGLLIWGAQRWEGIHESLGGLTVLAPVHALGSWMFAAFLLLHVYLTTTGPTPTANIRAMLHGWERSESHQEVLERS